MRQINLFEGLLNGFMALVMAGLYINAKLGVVETLVLFGGFMFFAISSSYKISKAIYGNVGDNGSDSNRKSSDWDS